MYETCMFEEPKFKKWKVFDYWEACPLNRQTHQAVSSKICYSSDITIGNPVSMREAQLKAQRFKIRQ